MLAYLLTLLEDEDSRALFRALYAECDEAIRRVAYRDMHDRHDAEDAVENAILGVILLRMIYGYTSDEAVKILRVIRANIWNTVASWFSDHIQIGFDDFVETSSVT